MSNPSARFPGLSWRLVYASALASEAVLIFLALRRARIPHPCVHYVSIWLGRYDFFGVAPAAACAGVLIAALVKKPPRWVDALTAAGTGGKRAPLSLWFLLAHFIFLAAFGLVSLFLIQRGTRTPLESLALARIYLWPALASLSALSFALGLLTLVKTRLPAAASLALPAVLLSLVANNLLSMIQVFLGPALLHATLPAAHGLLRCIFDHPVYDPEQRVLGSASFVVDIGGPCAGAEGIALMLLFCCLFWFVFRDRLNFPRALLLLPIGMAAVWLANVLRVTALVCIGTWISPALAVGGFHSSAGWLAFNALAVGLALLCANSPALGGGFPAPFLGSNAAAPYLAPLLVTIFSFFVLGRAAVRFDTFYALRVLATAAALACFWRRYRDLRWTFSWAAAGAGALTFAIWAVAGGWHGQDAATPRIASGLQGLSPGWRLAWLSMRATGSIITVPLAEELAFRGYLARWLARSDFESVAVGEYTPFSFFASSLAFGFLHQRWILGTLAGMIFAAAAMRRKRLADAVVAHMTANALLTILVLATGNWGLWN